MSVTPEQLLEQTLVIRSQLGDEAAFAELLTLEGPRLLRFTTRMLQSSPAQIADVSQDIWVAIFRALPQLADPSKFRPWAFRIARDRIYREYRRHKLSTQPIDDLGLDELPENGGRSTTTAEELEELRHCLDTISPQQREALLLRFFDEMSYEEIAQVTGASLGTVRSRIHYGKIALRTAWKGKTL